MAETVTVAGQKIPKTGLYVAGAVTVGIVGYAWYSRGKNDYAAQQAAIDESLPKPVEEPTDEPGFDVTGGGGPPATNDEWRDKAVVSLQNIGLDPIAVSAAIGKFLQRRSLTATEAGLVEQAIAAAGNPPQGGPWTIVRDATGAVQPPTLAAPASFTARLIRWRSGGVSGPRGDIPVYRLTWTPVTGAKDYHIRHVGGSGRFQTQTFLDTDGSKPGRPDTWEVAARNSANVVGTYKRLTFTAARR